jgi:hypothetical protein
MRGAIFFCIETHVNGGRLSTMTRKTKEIDFCKNILKPLLEGMSDRPENVRYRHGDPTEFGKDFTFSYVNPLNRRINAGVQAKWGDIKGKSTSLIGQIVNQIETAFAVPYKNKPDDAELYLNELYLWCSGKYTTNAITIIEKKLGKKYNAHYLDGSDIEHLKNKVAKRRIGEKLETKRTLNAFLIELGQNIEFAKEINSRSGEYIEKKMHFLATYRLNCLEKVLTLDIDDKWILGEAKIQWHNLTIQNNLLEQIRVGSFINESKKRMKENLWDNARRDIEGLENFRKYIVSYLDRFQWH